MSAAAPLHAAFSNALSDTPAPPESIQYMPPGRHRIRASQAGNPLTVEVTVDAETTATLQAFLSARLAASTDGRDDRPFFDFNHEDREAAVWPLEFFWPGDDPRESGVRPKVEWSDTGRRAIEGRTFRRFALTFHLDSAGSVTGSTWAASSTAPSNESPRYLPPPRPVNPPEALRLPNGLTPPPPPECKPSFRPFGPSP